MKKLFEYPPKKIIKFAIIAVFAGIVIFKVVACNTFLTPPDYIIEQDSEYSFWGPYITEYYALYGDVIRPISWKTFLNYLMQSRYDKFYRKNVHYSEAIVSIQDGEIKSIHEKKRSEISENYEPSIRDYISHMIGAKTNGVAKFRIITVDDYAFVYFERIEANDADSRAIKPKIRKALFHNGVLIHKNNSVPEVGVVSKLKTTDVLRWQEQMDGVWTYEKVYQELENRGFKVIDGEVSKWGQAKITAMYDSDGWIDFGLGLSDDIRDGIQRPEYIAEVMEIVGDRWELYFVAGKVYAKQLENYLIENPESELYMYNSSTNMFEPFEPNGVVERIDRIDAEYFRIISGNE